jgi:hypothetical protein
MHAMTCISSFADQRAADEGRELARQIHVEQRTEELKRDMWQDLEHLSDAVSDMAINVGYYRTLNKYGRNHPDAVRLLTLLRDGSDDLEAMRLIRADMQRHIGEAAESAAEQELRS